MTAIVQDVPRVIKTHYWKSPAVKMLEKLALEAEKRKKSNLEKQLKDKLDTARLKALQTLNLNKNE